MLDIKVTRESADRVRAVMKSRNMDADQVIEPILQIDVDRCRVAGEMEVLKTQQSADTRQIPILRKERKGTTEPMAQLKKLSDQIKEKGAQFSELEEKQRGLLLTPPNIPAADVPLGKGDTKNKELRRWHEPTQFDSEPKAYRDLGKEFGIPDPETAAKVTGTCFHFYKGLGACLERAIISFFLNTYIENGYTEVFPPFMVNHASIAGTGQLPKFEMDVYRVINKDAAEDYFPIPTVEVPVTNMHRSETLEGVSLPIKYRAYSACFRVEAGSVGRDIRDLIRQHQLNKVELAKFADPANSHQELEPLTNDAERALQLLGLPHRVVCLSTGDLDFSPAKTYDIEVRMPSYNRYVGISSCSNFENFQTRRVQIRFKATQRDKAQLVHTLNGPGVAVDRTVAAIPEDYQNEDGSITISEALRPFMGVDVIKCPEQAAMAYSAGRMNRSPFKTETGRTVTSNPPRGCSRDGSSKGAQRWV